MGSAIIISTLLLITVMLLGAKLTSFGWILLPVLALPLFTLWHPNSQQWRDFMLSGLLICLIMLHHRRLRHYILLPSCLVLTGALGSMSINF